MIPEISRSDVPEAGGADEELAIVAEENPLILSSEDSRLVGEVTFTDHSKLSFTLAGGPRGDPGLNFEHVP